MATHTLPVENVSSIGDLIRIGSVYTRLGKTIVQSASMRPKGKLLRNFVFVYNLVPLTMPQSGSVIIIMTYKTKTIWSFAIFWLFFVYCFFSHGLRKFIISDVISPIRLHPIQLVTSCASNDKYFPETERFWFLIVSLKLNIAPGTVCKAQKIKNRFEFTFKCMQMSLLLH